MVMERGGSEVLTLSEFMEILEPNHNFLLRIVDEHLSQSLICRRILSKGD